MPRVLRRVQIEAAAPSSGPFWPDTKSLIEREAVTPIVGGFMTPAVMGCDLAAVAESWAANSTVLSESERQDLVRVAQFYSVQQRSRRETKNDYLKTLKEILLGRALDDSALPNQTREDLQEPGSSLVSGSFSNLARHLNYPHFARPEQNPLRLLAELPLPLFITTCRHDFLEHALIDTKVKEPVSEILYWDQALESIPSIYDTKPDYKPSVSRPVVYHVFGRDEYPESLVLTEDDHLDCLVKLSELRGQPNVSDARTKARSIPTEVRTALSGYALLLLGYGVYNWDFRVLFRGLILGLGSSRASNPLVPRGICLQIRPSSGSGVPTQRVQEHLETYFDKSHFDVYWGDELGCVSALRALSRGGN